MLQRHLAGCDNAVPIEGRRIALCRGLHPARALAGASRPAAASPAVTAMHEPIRSCRSSDVFLDDHPFREPRVAQVHLDDEISLLSDP